MTVGFITPEYPHPRVKLAAGLATSTKNLITQLIKSDIKVIVFVYHQDEDDVIYDNGVEIHLIKSKFYKAFGWYLYRKYLNKYINNIVEKNKIDLLEAPDWTGITAFMTFKKPLVIRFHGSDAYFCKLEKRKQKFKNFFFEKLALKNADAYIAPTRFAGEETQKIFGLNKDKIKTIHYGLNLEGFVNETPQKFEANTLLYIGTIIRKKGVFELAKTFNKVIESVPDAKLILIGSDSGDYKTGSHSTYELMEQIFTPQAKKQASYLGKVPYAQINEYIKSANVCAFPSFAETLGMVTIESMALQKPVVNTNIGWAKELIDDQISGYLVHPDNIDLYAERIVTLFNDIDLCTKIGKHSREKVKADFDIDKQVKKNISYYKSLI
ncbi:glycosyltransferase family 4 protein [Flavivirga eckloniae]|uniref:Glycosyltransferase family 1 protein n=1 Tax=Flavivirga eckloniae TaxID=1803846 RepID=A0A2K9PM69_9FLAO|nr:glycosyltransferase family 4 protein [Flavivirga eckloniae]AUP78169.1 glycosyltransferase family 1 protein [Flavivirga eckloniae]